MTATISERIEIFDALIEGDTDRAEKAVKDHLRNAGAYFGTYLISKIRELYSAGRNIIPFNMTRTVGECVIEKIKKKEEAPCEQSISLVV